MPDSSFDYIAECKKLDKFITNLQIEVNNIHSSFYHVDNKSWRNKKEFTIEIIGYCN